MKEKVKKKIKECPDAMKTYLEEGCNRTNKSDKSPQSNEGRQEYCWEVRLFFCINFHSRILGRLLWKILFSDI